MDKDILRETTQLWRVANIYFDLALDQKKSIPTDFLKNSVGDIADKFESLEDVEKYQSLIYMTAHIMSCSVRLYSIDEILKTRRWNKYYNLINCKDSSKVEDKLKKDLDCFIHFLLRNMVAHSEEKRKKYKKYEVAFEKMYEVYLNMDFDSIFNSIEKAMKNIQCELKFDSKAMDQI